MITSLQNSRIKQWKKLHTRKERTISQTFLIEGSHLVEDAIKSDWNIQTIILQEGIVLPFSVHNVSTTIVSPSVFQYLSQTDSPQGIMAVVEMEKNEMIKDGQILLIDQVQDPGNLGTIIRTADAAGFSMIILGEGTVDLYNDKVIRATQGSIFHIPIIQADLKKQINDLKKNGYIVWAAALEDAKIYDQLDVPQKIALIVGNEGSGIRPEILKTTDEIVKIPIYGQAESLNVGIATGILMYHIKRKLAQ